MGSNERCRVCLENQSRNISVYEEIKIEGVGKELICKILLDCGNIQATKDDNKPQNICLPCNERAKEAYIFKLNCEKSNEILQNEIIENLFENCDQPDKIVQDEVIGDLYDSYNEGNINKTSVSETEDVMGAPQQIMDAAELPTATLLPLRTKSQYEQAYRLFLDWRRDNNMSSFSENVLLAYFENLSTRVKPPSLWGTYNRLRNYIYIKHNIDLRNFPKLRQKYGIKLKKPKKLNTLTPEQIREFLSTAPDEHYLFIKVGLIFAITGACRMVELMKVETTHVEDLGTALLVQIPDRKTEAKREFGIGGNLYNICKKYMELRPKNLVNSTRFFLHYQQGHCTKETVAINKFGTLANQAAMFLNLPNLGDYLWRYPECNLGDSSVLNNGYIEQSLSKRIQTYKILRTDENAEDNNINSIKLEITETNVVKFEDSNSIEVSTSSETEDIMGAPQEIMEAAELPTASWLSLKSKNEYERVYRIFMDWRRDNNMNSFSENVLLAYFENLSARVKSSTLRRVYSVLRTIINLKHNIDVSKFPKLCRYLKHQSDGYKPKKSKTLTPEQIREFLSTAPDRNYLFTKVGLIFAIIGACQREELMKLETTHVEDLGTALLVQIPERKTEAKREFVIGENFYNICKKYMELRPQNLVNSTFFLNYQQGRCTKQTVNITKFGSLANEAAKFLKLPYPTLYTGWESTGNNLVDCCADISVL